MDRHADPSLALAGLRERWGAAAPRRGTEVFGALATAPLPGERALEARPILQTLPGPGEAADDAPRIRRAPASVGTPAASIPTGFAELDALLVGGGLPRSGTVALAGMGSSGATTLAMRALAGAQGAGALAAWIDLPRSLDPVEAVARGVALEWLAVLVPDGLDQALAMAGTLLQARAVDVLVLDLGPGRETARPAADPDRATVRPADGPAGGWAGQGDDGQARENGRQARGDGRQTRENGREARGDGRPRPSPRPADQLARLAAFARRAGALLLVLLPPGAPPSLRAAVEESAGLRLELRRRGWIRLGREVVGQRTEICVTKDRHGAPDRRTALRILYAEGGPRDRCLARDELLAEEPVAHHLASAPPGRVPVTLPPVVHLPLLEITTSTDAPAPPRLAPPRAPARRGEPARTAPERAAGPRRAAMG